MFKNEYKVITATELVQYLNGINNGQKACFIKSTKTTYDSQYISLNLRTERTKNGNYKLFTDCGEYMIEADLTQRHVNDHDIFYLYGTRNQEYTLTVE